MLAVVGAVVLLLPLLPAALVVAAMAVKGLAMQLLVLLIQEEVAVPLESFVRVL